MKWFLFIIAVDMRDEEPMSEVQGEAEVVRALAYVYGVEVAHRSVIPENSGAPGFSLYP